ncbi:hypothetical protein DYBT9275_00363 [Dyadobacter sp. CECT 9275]|uniref:Alpha-2-macroglobulin domain-containing protein n=1 Tax=Dyadobacter helix TaxID=2822344 RepID=A0A916N2E1_9BACT|nr:alpha-2-macroglobulin family protein [Dyadobacter sp. CECT 9275]CAG4989743.1 hypothetical protein DYBT9275_00363 [Dyadobacter sp. CECT 9275]
MKSFFLLLVILALNSIFAMKTQSQNTDPYSAHWKKMEEHLKKGLPQSALEEVRQIYQLAKKDKQETQLIKAVLYLIDLQNETREDNLPEGIKQLETEISLNSEPARSILTSLLAKKYFYYYQTIRWQVYQRTETSNFTKDDVSTWTTEDFHDKIAELYLQSIAQEELLKRTSLDRYNPILITGNTRSLRPTLYDLLAHEALQYFSSDERNVKKPAYAFEINTASAYDPAADFIHRKFETRDTTALEYHALILYQKLIAFHINDPKPDALIDVDLLRLQYVRQKSVLSSSDQVYYQAINHVADQYQNTPAAAQAWYLLAAWHDLLGNEYQAGQDSANRYEKVRAAEICEKIIRENPQTEGGVSAYNLLRSIRQKFLQFSAENVNIPEKPFLIRVEFKNCEKLYFRLVKSPDHVKISPGRNGTGTYWDGLLALTPFKTWDQRLPDTHDYQQHSAELKIDGLPVGAYILITGTDPNFKDPKTLLGARQLYVSGISYVQNKNDFFVLNRDTGQPLPHAQVKLWESVYDYSGQGYTPQRNSTYTTDANGHFKRQPAIKLAENLIILPEITFKNDQLFLQYPVQTYYRDQGNRLPDETIYLFADRSLYRPGQTVYYKGIARKGDGVLTDRSQELNVQLFNANSESIETVSKTVNEYGSFSGSFRLPQGSLNGRFYIMVNNRYQVDFHVEEYKRPKFAVTFDTLRSSYKVNDTIRVSGKAMAYAGNAIGGAKVVYRIIRNPRFIYPWLSKRWWQPPSSPLEITHGEILTDDDGKFAVSFEALPDLKVSKKLDPVFDYKLFVDITDTNGETRSGEMTVSAGYKSLVLKVDTPESLPADSLTTLAIRTENMNGQFVAADVNVKISRLIPESRLIRKRYWQRPDMFVMTKAEFITSFPHDEYNDETDPENWPTAGIVFEKTGTSTQGKKFEINAGFQAGFYKIEVTGKDRSGDEIRDIRYIELTDPAAKRLNRPQYIWAEGSQPIEPGEKTSVKIASSADHLFIIHKTDKPGGSVSPYTFLTLSNEKRSFDFSARETDRGGYAVNYIFVKHNRIYQYTEMITVPWTNKDLSIEYLTFRDKTLPGSTEKWKIKITGYQKEKIAAEMLASMYDASLDQFYPHQWQKPYVWQQAYTFSNWNSSQSFAFDNAMIRYTSGVDDHKSFSKSYDTFIRNGVYTSPGWITVRGKSTVERRALSASVDEIAFNAAPQALNEVVKVGYGVKKDLITPEGLPTVQNTEKPAGNSVRKNFNETAFFMPDLVTNKQGDIEFSFTMPEALTRWKFQALVHTPKLALGYSTKEIVTQKELMVQPNVPRFLREGDRITFPAKVVNLTDQELKGTVSLQLIDYESNGTVDVLFQNTVPSKPFTVPAGQSILVQFPLSVPQGFTKVIGLRVVAKAGNRADGEENIVPVLSNRMLVTESLPLHIRGNGSKDFKLQKLINAGNSGTLKSQSLTVEYTSNPSWLAVQALPYLMEYPYDCAEQTWNRYYANSMAAKIVGSSPKIARVFASWQKTDTTALLSALHKNQELKSVLLEETPWVLAAKTETEQKKNIALLFDLVRMNNELSNAYDKLRQMQNSEGAFVWFKGGPSDRYMTQYILTGIGHLRKTSSVQKNQEDYLSAIVQAALRYLDKKIKADYDKLIHDRADLKTYIPGASALQYLYMRSFYPDDKVPSESQKAFRYFTERAGLTWTFQSKYGQGLIALALHRTGNKAVSEAILRSLKETAIYHDELGMYWKTTQRGWRWDEAPIERQALLIEAFQEISNDNKTVDDLKTWLLKNKQTNNWESTKATAEACYALLLKGTDWLAEEKTTTIKLGDTEISTENDRSEAGTGYFKKTIDADHIKAEMGNIQIINKGGAATAGTPTWGAIYWQYFEDLDKITFSETPLKISKKLFVEKNTDTGPLLTPVNEGDILRVGDKIKVRIELRADRDMEYVHLKDMRASALEPVNVLSGFKWQGGLGYYESTKDASTNFFFGSLVKGTYVFEYPLFVSHAGDFSNGITTIQCMYAPEFTAHSEGLKIKVTTGE